MVGNKELWLVVVGCKVPRLGAVGAEVPQPGAVVIANGRGVRRRGNVLPRAAMTRQYVLFFINAAASADVGRFRGLTRSAPRYAATHN